VWPIPPAWVHRNGVEYRYYTARHLLRRVGPSQGAGEGEIGAQEAEERPQERGARMKAGEGELMSNPAAPIAADTMWGRLASR